MKRTPEEWAAIDARVARSRARQGLPPKIVDPEILDRAAAVFLAAAPANPDRPRSGHAATTARRVRRAALLGDLAGAEGP